MSKQLAAALVLLVFTSAGAQEIQMYQSKTIQIRRAKEVQPYQSTPAPTPFQAQDIKPVQAESIEPAQNSPVDAFHAKDLSAPPTNQNTQSAGTPSALTDSRAFMGTWGTYVPGAVYETPSHQPGWNVLHVSPGAKGSQLMLFAEGKYQWGNLSGRWDKTGQSDYPIVLRKAKNGRDWKVGWAKPRPGKPLELMIWDGFTWYNGTKLK